MESGLVAALRRQADFCRGVVPLYGVLLDEAAADVAGGGVTAALLAPYADGDPMASMPGLRLMAAVHRLVLSGRARDLRPFYPSVGGTAPAEDAGPAFASVLRRHTAEIAALLPEPVQTNEPGRAAVLYGGLVTVAHQTGLPIRLLELGASAGLNLLADRFAYWVGGALVGAVDSHVVIDEPWVGRPPAPAGTPVQIIERRGCDLSPLDPSTERNQLRLLSLVWPDPPRVERLRSALRLAAPQPPPVDRAGAEEWLAAKLAEPVPGVATVVWHSVVRQYVDRRSWRRIESILDNAGGAADSAAPLVRLAMEPVPTDPSAFDLRMTCWPPGVTEILATVGAHGPPVRWHVS